MYPVTTLVSSILALFYIALAIKVITLRHEHRVSIGGGGHSDLDMAIRAHANFAEYAPMALILSFCAEANHASTLILSILITAFVLGRLSHAYAFIINKKHFKWRFRGMVLTFASIFCLALLDLYLLVR